MKQFISVLVAAIFAASSVTAIAQEKKADDKAKAGQMDKKDTKKSSTKKTSSKKPKSTKKADSAKKDEAKK